MKIQSISASEMEVLTIIWDNNNRLGLTEIVEKLERNGKEWKKTTIQTFLSRLCAKNYLKYDKSGRNSNYTAKITKEGYIEAQTRDFVNELYGGSAKNLITQLVKKDYVTQEDINALQSFWQNGDILDE